MRVRPEQPSDAAVIDAILARAFDGALHSSGREAEIVDRLRRDGALAISLIAEDEEERVGYVAFSPVTIKGAPGDWFGLGPVAVRPDKQRRGIDMALIASGLAHLRETGAAGCVVLGDPTYYGRFGFAADPALRYADVPPEYLQVLSFAGPPPSGSVEYHPAFMAA